MHALDLSIEQEMQISDAYHPYINTVARKPSKNPL
jgi:hypothetical protein